MKHKCTNCGHVDEIKATNQAKGGKARWKGTTKKQRSLAAKKAVAARWAKSENDLAHTQKGRERGPDNTQD